MQACDYHGNNQRKGDLHSYSAIGTHLRKNCYVGPWFLSQSPPLLEVHISNLPSVLASSASCHRSNEISYVLLFLLASNLHRWLGRKR